MNPYAVSYTVPLQPSNEETQVTQHTLNANAMEFIPMMPCASTHVDYNPYLTAENGHTADPHALSTDFIQTEPPIDESTEFNEDDYEIWEDEHGEIISVEKDQLYADDPYYQEMKMSHRVECGICRDNVLEKGSKFGLLTGGMQAFCLACSRAWRSKGILRQSKKVVRSCPICRQITWFIVPSDTFVTDTKRKNEIIDKYKARLADIRCKHF
eukprot:257863_1